MYLPPPHFWLMLLFPPHWLYVAAFARLHARSNWLPFSRLTPPQKKPIFPACPKLPQTFLTLQNKCSEFLLLSLFSLNAHPFSVYQTHRHITFARLLAVLWFYCWFCYSLKKKSFSWLEYSPKEKVRNESHKFLIHLVSRAPLVPKVNQPGRMSEEKNTARHLFLITLYKVYLIL